MNTLTFDVAHLLAGTLLLVSFMLLYQDRLYALLNVYALHAFVLALSVAWQAYAQDALNTYGAEVEKEKLEDKLVIAERERARTSEHAATCYAAEHAKL